jgi:2-dehydro-3-deoxygluconokinase
MTVLDVPAPESGGFDLAALGEVLLRLDPGDRRIHTARRFDVWEGGGEYNVAKAVSRVFRMRSMIITALADNAVGRLLEELILSAGVDMSATRWTPYDGRGLSVRNGLNFTERGFGVRGGVGVSDRGHSAASQLKPGDIDWDALFSRCKVRWLHTGGIFAGLSASTAALVLEAMQAARRHGAIVSYDLNYRPSIWLSQGGEDRAAEVNRKLVQCADVLIGNEEDYMAALGFSVGDTDGDYRKLDATRYASMLQDVLRQIGSVRVAAATLRTVHSASVNGWGAVAVSHSGQVARASRSHLEIFDRIGGGDGFVSGFAYGMLTGADLQTAVDYGVAHGALTMTTPGDTSMATLAEVKKLAAGGSARVVR